MCRFVIRPDFSSVLCTSDGKPSSTLQVKEESTYRHNVTIVPFRIAKVQNRRGRYCQIHGESDDLDYREALEDQGE